MSATAVRLPSVEDVAAASQALTAAHDACERIRLDLCAAVDADEGDVFTLDDPLVVALARLAATLELYALEMPTIARSLRDSGLR